MQEVSGVTGAGPIFQQTMLALHQSNRPTWLTSPKTIIKSKVDPNTGKILNSKHPRYSVAESVKTIYILEEAKASDYNDEKTVLDQRYSEWMEKPRRKFTLLDTKINNSPEERFRVLTPTKNATYYLDPDLPNSGSILALKATSQQIDWNSKTLKIRNNTAVLQEGKHTVTGRCLRTDRTETIQFTVLAL